MSDGSITLIFLQAHQDVVSESQQSHHRGLHFDLHLSDHPRPGFVHDEHRGFSLHLHGTRLDFDVRLHSEFWIDVQQNLAGPLDLHQRAAQ